MSEPGIEIVPLNAAHVASYQTFARGAFGAGAYQATHRYLRWLYEAAPHARAGLGDAKVAVIGGAVVGCFHKFYMPWRVGGKVEPICSPHNLFVAEAHRGGTGLALITEALRGERHVFLIGAGEAVHRIYSRMGATPLPSYWLRGVLNPFTAPLAFMLDRIRPTLLDAVLGKIVRRSFGVSLPSGRLEVHGTVGEALATEIADSLQEPDDTVSSIAWTPELVRWRLFSPDGPRHILVRLLRREARGPALAVLSLGVRRSLLVARIVAWRADEAVSDALVGIVRRVLTALGVNLWMGMTGVPAIAQAWRRGGLRPVVDAPAAMELHRPRIVPWGEARLEGAASDYGFEAIGFDRPN